MMMCPLPLVIQMSQLASVLYDQMPTPCQAERRSIPLADLIISEKSSSCWLWEVKDAGSLGSAFDDVMLPWPGMC